MCYRGEDYTKADWRKAEVSNPNPLRGRTVFKAGSAPSRFTFHVFSLFLLGEPGCLLLPGLVAELALHTVRLLRLAKEATPTGVLTFATLVMCHSNLLAGVTGMMVFEHMIATLAESKAPVNLVGVGRIELPFCLVPNQVPYH